jgi:hypothetical protein
MGESKTMIQWWLYISQDDLRSERLQCEQEGKDLAPLEKEFGRVEALDLTSNANQPAAQALLDATIVLPTRAGYQYDEPSTIEGIRAVRPKKKGIRKAIPKGRLFDKIYGAWQGRI